MIGASRVIVFKDVNPGIVNPIFTQFQDLGFLIQKLHFTNLLDKAIKKYFLLIPILYTR
jgi:hypothetical protein